MAKRKRCVPSRRKIQAAIRRLRFEVAALDKEHEQIRARNQEIWNMGDEDAPRMMSDEQEPLNRKHRLELTIAFLEEVLALKKDIRAEKTAIEKRIGEIDKEIPALQRAKNASEIDKKILTLRLEKSTLEDDLQNIERAESYLGS
ncbi:MAG: hypothetical protein AAB897_00405 [Patescibacteria group bacterium]